MSEASHAWPYVPLGKLAAEMCLGKMLDKQKNRGTLQPYLRNVNVRWFSFDLDDLKEMRFEPGEERRFGLKSGDLVVCEGGEPGRAAVWNGQATDAKIQKALHRVRFRPNEYDPSFAMYYLYFATITNRLAEHYTGTTIKHLTGKALTRVEFPVPPITEQRQIVAKIEELFSDLDAGVAALSRAQVNLKRYRAAVLKAAVEGKLTAAWRAENPCTEPASELLKRILANRRQKWEQQQLAKYAEKCQQPPKGWREKYKEPIGPNIGSVPKLPESWCWATVDQVGEVQSGIQKQPKRAPKSNAYPYLRVANVLRGRLDLSDMQEFELFNGELERLRLEAGDLLVVEGNGSKSEIGRSALWNSELPDCVHQNHIIRVRYVAGTPEFLDSYWNSPIGSARVMEKAASTSGLYTLSVAKVASIPVPLAPSAEQATIAERVAELVSIIDQAESQLAVNLRRSSRLRQAVLQHAFEGRLVA